MGGCINDRHQRKTTHSSPYFSYIHLNPEELIFYSYESARWATRRCSTAVSGGLKWIQGRRIDKWAAGACDENAITIYTWEGDTDIVKMKKGKKSGKLQGGQQL